MNIANRSTRGGAAEWLNSAMTKVYAHMGMGLLVTFLAALVLSSSPVAMATIFGSSLKWVVIFGDPGWDALQELQIGKKSIINTLLDLGLKVVKLPHFAQNFQQRELYTLSDEQAQRVIDQKPEWAKFAPAAAMMRNAVFKAMATAV